MKCFTHPEKEAVAICKACGKAVCHKCGLESNSGIACRQHCANTLSSQNELHATQVAYFKSLKRMNLLGSLFSIGMGLLFIYFSYQGFGLVYDFVFLLGTGFAVYGIMAQLVNMFIVFKSKKNQNL